MKINLLILIIALSCKSFSGFYVGFGPSYHVLQEPTSNTNPNDIGLMAEFESRYFCNYWFGLNLNYIALERGDDLTDQEPFFENAIMLSPKFRYVFSFTDMPVFDFNPYIFANLHLGMIQNNDQLGSMSLGSGIGAGTTIAFDANDNCYMIDLGFNYSGYNNIYKANGRADFNTLQVYLILSYRL